MKAKKKSAQAQFIRTAFSEVVASGELKIETVEPKKIKESLSRYKQEKDFAGTLFFEAEANAFNPDGSVTYILTVTYIKG